ncbi:signal peptidase I [Piscinibacter terrae]|uniref:signal peptidase I n=1 Tax=Piscinibacter terrae TaxID=2496871 RepID=UPI0013875D93|nr:signal peptidase I [Albitalea terrae]
MAALGLLAFLLVSPASPWVTDVLSLVYFVGGAIHAYWLAAKSESQQPRRWFSRWYGVMGAIACLVVASLTVRSFFFEPFRQPSQSMRPTLPMGATLVVQKWGYGNYGTFGVHGVRRPVSALLERGDILVFEYPKDRAVHFVKRLVGLPGDKVTYKAKMLFVNDMPAEQHFVRDELDAETLGSGAVHTESLMGREYSILLDKARIDPGVGHLDFPMHEQCTSNQGELSCRVPAGHFFVLGDNRDNSADSRFWGFVPMDHITGKVVLVKP